MLGLKVAAVGMLVTFFGLIALVGLINANKYLAMAINGSKKNKTSEQPKKVVAQQPKAQAVKTDNLEVMAAISAAVAVMMDGQPFQIKSVKKAVARTTNLGAVSAWEIVAMQEQTNNF